MRRPYKILTVLAGLSLATMSPPVALGQEAPGQTVPRAVPAMPGAAGQVQTPETLQPGAPGLEAGISATTLTFKSHQIGPGASAGNLEGDICPATYKMLSGACHPFYNDRVTIINQFPNIPLNTWRCGFKNNTGAAVTVWIYTLCGR